MSLPAEYIRVTKSRPCPICERPDWCLIHKDGQKVVCARTPSQKLFGEAGWVHDVDAAHAEPIEFKPRKQTIGIDVAGLAIRCEHALYPEALQSQADALGVSAESLKLLRMGWSKGDQAFTFPMRSGAGDIVGIRLRNANAEKWSVRGGKEGLFYSPLRLAGETLYIVEGPTDAAAMLDMGFPTIGRPSCTGGTEHLLKMIRGHHHVVIVADHDGPGERGAEALADRCVGVCRSVKVIEPLAGKDVREWKVQYHLNADRLRRLAMNAIPWNRISHGS